MRVFLDENMPRQLGRVLVDHEVSFVEKEGWKGKQNGELLRLVEAAFDVLLTSDANLEFQNELAGRSLSLIVLPTNNLTLLRANAIAVKQVLDELAGFDPPIVVTVGWKGERSLRRPGAPSGAEPGISPVFGFGRSGKGRPNDR
ncbi:MULTISPECIES: hypothetical protein [unclassified Aureimonas]|uniref:hypothetical protein n=1 Tax=unclassified Aureimonas TaxID=2615206 RepID=UPI0006FF190F|nr:MULTISPECIES: hypothetical protein [unclassified Aureimonas]KQT64430.1 hypothetical protein ASG62_05575 [Aureimonas sp. Leaf427]KQT81619.1 hypothetical protein ASG54_02855 [Aureimonas sp. Leaf460]